jgi:hypothetical protein
MTEREPVALRLAALPGGHEQDLQLAFGIQPNRQGRYVLRLFAMSAEQFVGSKSRNIGQP